MFTSTNNGDFGQPCYVKTLFPGGGRPHVPFLYDFIYQGYSLVTQFIPAGSTDTGELGTSEDASVPITAQPLTSASITQQMNSTVISESTALTGEYDGSDMFCGIQAGVTF